MNNSKLWKKVRLKYLVTINDESLPEDTDPYLEIHYIDIGNVESSGEIDEPSQLLFMNSPSRARRIVRRGDTIISTVRTYLQAIASFEEVRDNLIVSTGFAVIRPRPNKFYYKFCKYALRESSFIEAVQKRSVGVSYPAINTSDLGDIPIKVPPYSEQIRISEFLDKELSHLDTLINTKERLLGLLEEKRQALIISSVLKGLNPNAKLKNSDINWIGDIPKHWRVERSRWLFQEINDRSETGDEELLTVSHITGVTPRSEKDVFMFEAETTEGYKKCDQGDLVINTLWAWMGAMGISPKSGIVSPAYHVYRPNKNILSGYVDAIVRIPLFASEVTRFSKGVWSSRLRLYPEGFYEVYFPVPPIDEQEEIVDFISKESKKINELKSVTEKSVLLLKERRDSLITEAVFGDL